MATAASAGEATQLEACYSILATLEEMELGDIGALDDVRDAIRRADNPKGIEIIQPSVAA